MTFPFKESPAPLLQAIVFGSLETCLIFTGQRWIVGFRCVYFSQCVLKKETFAAKLKASVASSLYLAETPKQKHLRGSGNFYYQTHVKLYATFLRLSSFLYEVSRSERTLYHRCARIGHARLHIRAPLCSEPSLLTFCLCTYSQV